MGATCSLGLCQNDKAGEENLTYDIVKKPVIITITLHNRSLSMRKRTKNFMCEQTNTLTR